MGLPTGALFGLSGCLSTLDELTGDDGDPEPLSEEVVVDETVRSRTAYTVYLNAGDHLLVEVDESGRLGATVTVSDPEGATVEREDGVDEASIIHVAEVAGTFEVTITPDESVDVEIVIETYAG